MLAALDAVAMHSDVCHVFFSSECQEFHVFTDCRTLPVTYTFSDPSIFKLEEDHSKSKEEIV